MSQFCVRSHVFAQNVFQIVKEWRHTCPSPPPGQHRKRRRSFWQRWTSSPKSSNLNTSKNSFCKRKKNKHSSQITNVYTIFFNIQKSFNLQEQPLLKIYRKTKSSEVNVVVYGKMTCTLFLLLG